MPKPEVAATPAPPSEPRKIVSAAEMGARQREISVSEFFTKNRHLLGFDNPRKALLTCVKEAVDNALDACEEAGILPEVVVTLEVAPSGDERRRRPARRRASASPSPTTGPASSASRSRRSSASCSTARSSTACA